MGGIDTVLLIVMNIIINIISIEEISILDRIHP